MSTVLTQHVSQVNPASPLKGVPPLTTGAAAVAAAQLGNSESEWSRGVTHAGWAFDLLST